MTEHVLHLPNHLDEALISGTACNQMLAKSEVTFVGTADRHHAYYAGEICRGCADKYCLNCTLTPGVCYGTTCKYCLGTGVDKTPYGTGGDHCPFCGADWRERCGH